MTIALVAGLLGLLGTVVGAVLTTWTARQTADRSDQRAREERRRQEYRSAVIGFATALLAYRRAEISYWDARHGGATDEGATAAEAEAYRTRAELWNAFYELDFSIDRRDLIDLADRALGAAFSIAGAGTKEEMTDRSYHAREALAALMEVARNAQPGAAKQRGGRQHQLRRSDTSTP